MSDGKQPDHAVSEVVEQVEPLIKTLPPEKKSEVRRIIATSVQYQGPLPPPEMLAEYANIIPNGADRLLTLLEKQTSHRIAVESMLVSERVSVTKRGQFIAAGLSVFFGLLSAFLGYFGHDWLAGSLGVTTIVGLAVVFVLGKEPGQPSQPEPDAERSRASARKARARKSPQK